MKEGIHPNYRPAKVTCSCGNEIITRTTRGSYRIEICSRCHPFYTGKQKIIDSEGRIERFQRKYASVKPAPKA